MKLSSSMLSPLPRNAGQQARDRVDHDERRELAAGQHIVADRQLLRKAQLERALVDALVVAAEKQHQFLFLREFLDDRLRERPPARGQVARRSRPDAFFSPRRRSAAQHHHARAAAERVVVGVSVLFSEYARMSINSTSRAGLERAARMLSESAGLSISGKIVSTLIFIEHRHFA